MRSHSKGKNVRVVSRRRAREREALEREWFPRAVFRDELAAEVVHGGAAKEPFHRWLAFRQGFAPALARRFLAEAKPKRSLLLDPFSGSGTFVFECARAGRRACGVEALNSLAFLAAARFLNDPPGTERVLEYAGRRSGEPSSRVRDSASLAVLLLAEAAGAGSAGRPKASPAPWETRIAEVLRVMSEDLKTPLTPCCRVFTGDARAQPVSNGCVGGILTSPPYLSRHDYPRILKRVEALFHGGPGAASRGQMRAVPGRGHRRRRRGPKPHPAAREAAARLEEAGRSAEARGVRAYFADLALFFGECARVLAADAPAWVVLGGAFVAGEYVPTDFIAADLAKNMGMRVEQLFIARRVTQRTKRLGGLDAVSPRETVLVLRKRGG